jgi:hypothetical protein
MAGGTNYRKVIRQIQVLKLDHDLVGMTWSFSR